LGKNYATTRSHHDSVSHARGDCAVVWDFKAQRSDIAQAGGRKPSEKRILWKKWQYPAGEFGRHCSEEIGFKEIVNHNGQQDKRNKAPERFAKEAGARESQELALKYSQSVLRS
jgi:hypothetical protein